MMRATSASPAGLTRARMALLSSHVVATPGVCVLLLVLAAAFWGSGNIANKTLLADIGPFTALALRGAIAAVIVLPLIRFDRGPSLDRGYWSSAALVSALFLAAASLQQAAFQWTTVTNAGFLVNSCTIMTPLLAWVFLREVPDRRVMVAALVMLGGAWLMCGAGSLAQGINAGDLACLVSAVFYAGWAIALGHHAMRYGRPLVTAAIQFAVTGAVLAPVALALEGPTFAGIVAAGPEVLYLAVFCTAGACVLTTIAQRKVPASLAVMVLSLESVFGTVAAFMILDERPAATVMIGGVLMLVAVVVAVGHRRSMTSS